MNMHISHIRILNSTYLISAVYTVYDEYWMNMDKLSKIWRLWIFIKFLGFDLSASPWSMIHHQSSSPVTFSEFEGPHTSPFTCLGLLESLVSWLVVSWVVAAKLINTSKMRMIFRSSKWFMFQFFLFVFGQLDREFQKWVTLRNKPWSFLVSAGPRKNIGIYIYIFIWYIYIYSKLDG